MVLADPLTITSIDPATGDAVRTVRAGTGEDVARAVAAARAASRIWSRTPASEREAVARRFGEALDRGRATLGEMISLETGKPAWEAQTEVQSMVGKVELSIRARAQRTADFAAGPGQTRFRPQGVVAVFGPFNFPGHLPNGHIVPALLAGNAVLFKPSEYAPGVAEITAERWREAGLPEGVLTLVQGGRETGAALAEHPGIDGLFFTGSSRTGQWLAQRFAVTPEKILALELGGNNPLVVWEAADLKAAAFVVAQSAFLTAGQRCSCARRLIVPEGAAGDAVAAQVVRMASGLRVGGFRDQPEPFMGPVISARAADGIQEAQDRFEGAGGEVLLRMTRLKGGTGLLSPGIVDVTAVRERPDEEIFGPLLQVIRVGSFEAALEEANRTRYGLAAALVSDRADLYERFREEVRAGVVNWNHQTTGASGAAPFGGVGRSGNHRPSGYFAADYCAYPVASIEAPAPQLPPKPPPGVTL